MRPFFSYFGGKWRAAPRYPRPEHDLVIEPFAGSAGYSVRFDARRVLLFDLDSYVVATWRYLIGASRAEIESLPDLAPDQTVADLRVCEEARWLIGWWLSSGSAQPKRSQGRWARQIISGDHSWGDGGKAGWRPAIRDRIASQVDMIREWKIEHASYRDAPDVDATWFVDPPYQVAGRYYRHSEVDYADVASFVRSRRGLVIACEQHGADWLPFTAVGAIKATAGSNRSGTSAEVAFVAREPNRGGSQ